MWYISGYKKNEPINLDNIATIKLEVGPGVQSFIKFVVPGSTDLVWRFSSVTDMEDEYKKLLKAMK